MTRAILHPRSLAGIMPVMFSAMTLASTGHAAESDRAPAFPQVFTLNALAPPSCVRELPGVGEVSGTHRAGADNGLQLPVRPATTESLPMTRTILYIAILDI
jgi:hypothetical protein